MAAALGHHLDSILLLSANSEHGHASFLCILCLSSSVSGIITYILGIIAPERLDPAVFILETSIPNKPPDFLLCIEAQRGSPLFPLSPAGL